MLAAVGMVTELVSDPSSRLLEVSSQYFEARALRIAAERRIPDLLAKGQGQGQLVDGESERGDENGVSIDLLADRIVEEYRVSYRQGYGRTGELKVCAISNCWRSFLRFRLGLRDGERHL